jgi:hypothetical protein
MLSIHSLCSVLYDIVSFFAHDGRFSALSCPLTGAKDCSEM